MGQIAAGQVTSEAPKAIQAVATVPGCPVKLFKKDPAAEDMCSGYRTQRNQAMKIPADKCHSAGRCYAGWWWNRVINDHNPPYYITYYLARYAHGYNSTTYSEGNQLLPNWI